MLAKLGQRVIVWCQWEQNFLAVETKQAAISNASKREYIWSARQALRDNVQSKQTKHSFSEKYTKRSKKILKSIRSIPHTSKLALTDFFWDHTWSKNTTKKRYQFRPFQMFPQAAPLLALRLAPGTSWASWKKAPWVFSVGSSGGPRHEETAAVPHAF